MTTGPRREDSAGRSWLWWGMAVLGLLLVVAERLVRTPRYFYVDDSQAGSLGLWYAVGERILNGGWTILSPGHWGGGNYLAEQQWGLWSPINTAIAVALHSVDNAVVFVTAVKIVFLIVLLSGVFLLARSYGASAPWSAVGGLAAAFAGQTMYMDAPSWITGLQATGLFAWTWWALRRAVVANRSPVPYFISAFLLITIGYVFGVIELVLLFLVVLVVALVERQPRSSLSKILGLGVFSGLLTVAVYLPGVLTGGVTTRSDVGIYNDQFLNMDLSDLVTAALPNALTTVHGWWGQIAPAPIQYLGWFLPLLIVMLPRTRSSWRQIAVPLVILVVTLGMALGPSAMGPLRWPVRMLPYVGVALGVVFAVRATAVTHRGFTKADRLVVLASAAVVVFVSWAQFPDNIRAVVLGATLLLLGLAAVMWTSTRYGSARTALVALGLTVLAMFPQSLVAPESPLRDLNLPDSVSAMQEAGEDLEHGILTVGDVRELQEDRDSFSESLFANLWYLTDLDAVSVYTVMPMREYADELCLRYNGGTWCRDEALDRIFDADAHGNRLADDLRLNSVIVIKGSKGITTPEVPAGWTLEDREESWLLSRKEPVERAGGPIRSEGVEFSIVDVRQTEVTIRLDAVEADGGSVVFSRLDWPGYHVVGKAQLGDPERGFLLTVDVPPEAEGQEVTVRFRPPGWTAEVAAAIGAGVLALAWTVADTVARIRRRRAGNDTPTSATG